MKPWLLEILACPIDKAFPLEVNFFSWENEENFFPGILQEFNAREVPEGIVELADGGKSLEISDEMTQNSVPVKQYIQEMLKKIEELTPIKDETGSPSQRVLEVLRSTVKTKIEATEKDLEKATGIDQQKKKLTAILPELVLVNKYKLSAEVDEGIFYCNECHRWYPIIETIPQMLPDNLRSKKDDLAFLEKWTTKIPGEIKSGGQPWV